MKTGEGSGYHVAPTIMEILYNPKDETSHQGKQPFTDELKL